MSLDWLVSEEELEEIAATEQVDIGGEGGFVRSTITKWLLKPRWAVIKAQVSQDIADDEGLTYDFVRALSGDNGWNYYCTSREAANMISAYSKNLNGNSWGEPSLHITFAGDLDEIVGWQNEDKAPKDVFTNGLFNDCQMYTFGSKLHAHEPNLVFVPSLVQAIALSAGFINAPVFDFSELAKMQMDSMVEHCEDLFGVPPLGIEDTVKELKAFRQRGPSRLLEARKKLWVALGADESDPKFWEARAPGQNGVPSGSNLHKILSLITSQEINGKPHKMEIVAEMSQIPNPLIQSVDGSGNLKPNGLWTIEVNDDGEEIVVLNEDGGKQWYNQIPVVLNVWKSIEDARKDSGDFSVDYPDLPGDWKGLEPKEFIKTAKSFIADEGIKFNPAGWKKLAESMSVEVSEMKEWEEFLN